MDWTKFNNHGESNNHAFEVMCNLLFEAWCKQTYKEKIVQFSFVNGDGGDGGVEAYCVLDDGNVVGVQSKWFPMKIEDSQIRQIESSIQTAKKVRPKISTYVVCIPRDLGSKKIVKGGGLAQNTEADRWIALVEKCKLSYPDLEIILWDETRLQERLLQPETQGAYKYWFENTVVFDQQFELSYHKAVNSWAKHKYIPEIHTLGYIHERLGYFLGCDELSKKRYDEVGRFVNRLEALSRAYKDILALGLSSSAKELEDKIVKDIESIGKWLALLIAEKEAIKDGGSTRFTIQPLGLSCSAGDIKDYSWNSGRYFHYRDAEKLLEDIEDDFFNLCRLLEQNDSNKLIFTGVQGTGKTAGIVAEASLMLQSNSHLPVIIHAKDYSEGENWASIITRTLGLNTEWNEIDLLCALQNAAFLRKHMNEDELFVTPNCVICVDGIDEATSWKFWRDRIEETVAFSVMFPRIKFVFLSRPYVFEDRYELAYSDCFHSLPMSGDGDLEEICDKYFAAYRIDIGENNWIRENLKTPIAVKLFCDIYGNRKIDNLPQNTVVLTELLKAKIYSLEQAYSIAHHITGNSRLVYTSLVQLAELFAENNTIPAQKIANIVSEPLKSHLQDILDFLANEGFIYSYSRQEDDFALPEVFYSWGIQPAFDYLIAQKIFRRMTASEKVDIENVDGIYQMLSLISIENGKLLTEYPNVNMDNQEAFELICYALANCSLEIAKKYTEYVKHLMQYSVAEFREIYTLVIQAVLRAENHPLGAALLDDFLRGFTNPAERDIWWSIPTYLRDNYDAEWRAFSEINFDSIKLKDTDSHCAAPLAVAWSLSNVNNEVRQSSRLKLTKWGIAQPLEFFELFKMCITVNDEQILEDIFAVAYGIALEQFICNEYLEVVANWMIANVFSQEGLKIYENVAIRYYGSGLVRIAISKGLVNENIKELIRPPYNYEPAIMPLCKEALDATRMGGYKAIDYDLARYVLCDHLDDYFRNYAGCDDYHACANQFLEQYMAKYEIAEVKIEGFIIALAYQYLLDQGWNPEIFWSYEDKRKFGVDIVIRRTYYPATHGAMSRVMTVAEKNVWLAKHRIEAVFANEIPLHEYGCPLQYVTDYSRLENFVNTYQDYVNKKNQEALHCWFNADILAAPEFNEMNKDNIETWMNDTGLPLFEKWFSDHDGRLLLCSFTDVQNNISGVQEAAWISSGAVREVDFERFLRLMDGYFEDRTEMLNVNDFHTYQDCRCYCTPQEACLVHYDREINRSLLLPDNEEDIEIFKLTEECLSADELETEKSFSFPSIFVREITGIVYGDGYSYSDNEGRVIANYSTDGENWGTHQNTLTIDADAMHIGLAANKYKMFWLYRLYKEPSPKARERFPDIQHSTDRTYLVWKEGEVFRSKELLPVQPVRENVSVDIPDEIKALFKTYVITDDAENS